MNKKNRGQGDWVILKLIWGKNPLGFFYNESFQESGIIISGTQILSESKRTNADVILAFDCIFRPGGGGRGCFTS